MATTALANIELIGSAGCPYVQRSVALLVHHQIPFTYRQVDLPNKPQWFLDKSPLGKVPALVRGKDFIFESQVINEFIEDSLPAEQRIQPSDPFLRAQNKAWIEFGSSLVGDVFGVLAKPTKEDFEAAHIAFKNKLALFETHATLFKGPYFNGDKASLIDLAWGPFASILFSLDAAFGFDIGDKASNPKLSQWLKAASAIPSVKVAAALQLQDTPDVDTNNPASYVKLDVNAVVEKTRPTFAAMLTRRFGNSYAFQNKLQR